MIRCMIVDDEKPARDELRFLLEAFSDIEVVSEAENGTDACDFQKKSPVELVFLDINMPGISGVRVAEKWMAYEHPPMIIFTTAYDEYAIRAFDLHAIDYLLKPINSERLASAIDRVREKQIIDQTKAINELADKMSEDRTCGMDRICFESSGRLIPVDIQNIIYAAIEDKNTVIHTTQGVFVYGHSLSYLQERLRSDHFLRTHRGYLMNVNFVEAIEPWFNNTFMVKMKHCDEMIPVSRNQVKTFKEVFNL